MTFRAFLAGHDEIDGHGATEQVFYFIFFYDLGGLALC